QRIRVARRGQRIAHRDRAGEALAEKRRIHRLGAVEGPDARADLGMRAVGGLRDGLAGTVPDLHGVADFRLADHFLDGAGEDPRVAAPERFLAALLEDEDAHRFFARGCAASYTFASAW